MIEYYTKIDRRSKLSRSNKVMSQTQSSKVNQNIITEPGDLLAHRNPNFYNFIWDFLLSPDGVRMASTVAGVGRFASVRMRCHARGREAVHCGGRCGCGGVVGAWRELSKDNRCFTILSIDAIFFTVTSIDTKTLSVLPSIICSYLVLTSDILCNILYHLTRPYSVLPTSMIFTVLTLWTSPFLVLPSDIKFLFLMTLRHSALPDVEISYIMCLSTRTIILQYSTRTREAIICVYLSINSLCL